MGRIAYFREQFPAVIAAACAIATRQRVRGRLRLASSRAMRHATLNGILA
ncbi:MAG: hypothetical protein KC442_20560 [Thermomicrobiales bacterium]|nr:hypothetical protein [Thermomicrobiales bacterium]MCA9880204.1 hypothetical protein [Thermomicrobiales bacterium]